MISFIFSLFTIVFIYIHNTDIYAMNKLEKERGTIKNQETNRSYIEDTTCNTKLSMLNSFLTLLD